MNSKGFFSNISFKFLKNCTWDRSLYSTDTLLSLVPSVLHRFLSCLCCLCCLSCRLGQSFMTRLRSRSEKTVLGTLTCPYVPQRNLSRLRRVASSHQCHDINIRFWCGKYEYHQCIYYFILIPLLKHLFANSQLSVKLVIYFSIISFASKVSMSCCLLIM